jgi:release factor glutamine methyltransferase
MNALTLADVITEATQTLRPVSPSARRDAELLVQHAAGLTRLQCIVEPERVVAAGARAALAELVERRRRGEPIAYIMGRREFWSLDLEVSPATLIPRPETELLVERALMRGTRDTRLNVADLGTGSGAVALAIACERPQWRVVATERSSAALAVALCNSRRLSLGNVEFVAGDWFEPIAGRRFDAIVSNPPYLRADDPHLQRGDVRAEPRAALVGGDDGLEALRHLIAGAGAHLVPGGWLMLEHGYDQADAVRAMFAAHGFDDIVSLPDLAGHERVTEARRR